MKLLLLVGIVLAIFCSSSNADDKKGPKVTDKVGKLMIIYLYEISDMLTKNFFLNEADKNEIK